MNENSFPSGVLTFLFSDIQGSTPLWEKDPAGMSAALELHNAALHDAIKAHNGRVFKIIGDEFQAVFLQPQQAVQAALTAQLALADTAWGHVGPLRVRMGIHTGPAQWQGLDYAVTHTFNRTARIMSTGHGGQILISLEAVEQTAGQLPPGVTLLDMGRCRLKGLTQLEHLFQINAPGLAHEFPPLKTIDGATPQIRHSLPQPGTPFIGRQQELRELGQLFAQPDTRLVTITGAGGIGKTRLALEFAWRRRGQYASGVHFISLAPLSAPEQILPATAHAVGLQFKGDRQPQEQLLRYLKGCQSLLIFDNFEHLRDGSGLLAGIVQAAAQVDVLATSRERLGLSAECLYEVGGLQLPLNGEREEQLQAIDAVRMFISYARRVRPDYELVIADRVPVAQLCRLVEGMPLAIELAAAWTRTLAPAELVSELQEDQRLLARRSPDVPLRQRSMQASFDYSWRLLSEEEQRVLMKLSVFRGGFNHRSARDVAGANTPILGSLVDKSMLRRDPESGRFQIHELLRQLAEVRLQASGLAESTIRNHADYFLALVAGAKDKAVGEKGQAEYAQLLELELDNCRVAMRRLLEGGKAATALRLTLLLAYQFHWREQAQWIEEALQVGAGHLPAALEAEAQLCLAEIILQEDVRTRGRAYWIDVATRGLALYEEIGDERGMAQALHILGFAYTGYDFDLANAYYAQASAVYEKLGEDPIDSLLQRGLIHLFEGYFKEAREINGQVMAIAQKNGDERLEAEIKRRLAGIAFYEGDLEGAQVQTEEVLNFRSSQGRPASIFTRTRARQIQLDIALARGDVETARGPIAEWLHYMQEQEHFFFGIFMFQRIAKWLQLRGQYRQAAFWMGAFQSIRDLEMQPLEKIEQSRYRQMKAAVRAALGDERYSFAYQEGYNTAVEDAVDLGLALISEDENL